MKVYFAAVGSDLKPSFDRAGGKSMLFSFWDVSTSGFAFRAYAWNDIVGEERNRLKYRIKNEKGT